MKILVVEDEPKLNENLVEELRDRGYAVDFGFDESVKLCVQPAPIKQRASAEKMIEYFIGFDHSMLRGPYRHMSQRAAAHNTSFLKSLLKR